MHLLLANRRTALCLVSFVLGIAGCGSDASRVVLAITSPEPDQILSMADDDLDPERPGLQFDVTAGSRGVKEGTSVTLFIGGDEQAVAGEIDSDGNVKLEGVTLPAGTNTISLETATGSVSSDPEQEYTLQGLVITAPDNGAMLRASDDEDESTEGIQISVTVEAFAVDAEQEITLLLDGDAASAQQADAQGKAVFEGVTLEPGSHTLKATTGEGETLLESGEITIGVSNSCAEIAFIAPMPPSDDASSIVLGGDSCPTDSAFTTRVEIATDVGDGKTVNLIVNGTQVATTEVDGATAVFEDVVLDRRSDPNTIRVQVENSEGTLCDAAFPADIIVDCAGPDCSIVGPTPVVYVDGDGNQTLYLNESMQSGSGFDVEVDTNADDEGRDVELIVDGNSRAPRTATIAPDGVATFDSVPLNEGEHTVEAKCTDSSGNSTYSTMFTWVADVTACDVAITAPAEDDVLVPADDEVTTTDGTQIVVSSDVVGDDCVAQRASVCDPIAGIEDEAFAPFDGSAELLATITLDDDDDTQDLCVEVEDRAGNSGTADIQVAFRADAPEVAIDAPANNAQFNALGGGGYVGDADRDGSPTACDAEFTVSCSEDGVEVELRHNSATGAIFASGTCDSGQATITDLFEDGDGTAVIVATQTISGSSGRDLVGASSAITLTSDCAIPAAAFNNNPCGTAGTNFTISVAQAAARDVRVSDTTGGTSMSTLHVTHVSIGDVTTMSDPTASSVVANLAIYDDVDLGGEGTVTLLATMSDDFENTAQVSCMATITSDLPTLDVTAPDDGAAFGPSDDCDGGGAYGVLVQAALDQQANRTAAVVVNGGIAINLTSSIDGSGVLNACIPVTSPGPNELVVSVTSTISGASAQETRDIVVIGAAPGASTGIVIDDLATAAGTGAGHRGGVSAVWTQPTPEFAGQLTSYELRCADTEIAMAASGTEKNDWWDAATEQDLPVGLTPTSPTNGMGKHSAPMDFRVAEPRHCVVRAGDPLDQLSPIVRSTDLTIQFRELLISSGPSGTPQLGFKVAAVGDVDGDGIEDVLVGGRRRAELIFGTATPTSPTKVAFTGNATSGVGFSVSGIGDFNDDGLADFAVGNWLWNANSGQVAIFFGRPRADWPSSVDIETSCNADLCFEGSAGYRLSRYLAAAGDFNNDGIPDLALGSPTFPSGTNDGQLLVALGDDYEVRTCATGADCRASETCIESDDVDLDLECELNVGEIFWRMRFSIPTGNWLNPPMGAPVARINGFRMDSNGALPGLGFAVVGIGAFDANDGDDLIVSAPTVDSNRGEVHYLSGRAHSGTTGFDILTTAALGLPGQPAATPIAGGAPGTTAIFGATLGWLGNVYDVPGAVAADVPDLAIGETTGPGTFDQVTLQPGDRMNAGDPAFSATRVTVFGQGSAITQSIGSALNVVNGMPGDLDQDGRGELLTGTLFNHQVVLFYADRLVSSIDSNSIDKSDGISITLETTVSDSADRVAQFTGDFNNDGYDDIVVGDWRANTNLGQVILLY